MESSQLTNSLHHFSEGWLETTNQLMGYNSFFLQKVHTVSDRLSTGMYLYVNMSNNPARFLWFHGFLLEMPTELVVREYSIQWNLLWRQQLWFPVKIFLPIHRNVAQKLQILWVESLLRNTAPLKSWFSMLSFGSIHLFKPILVAVDILGMGRYPIPAPCVKYLPTFSPKFTQM